jgi:hypothetical protein
VSNKPENYGHGFGGMQELTEPAAPASETPEHVPAAFINAIADEGTKAEAIEWLQKTWNERCDIEKRLRAAEQRAERARQEALEELYRDLGTLKWMGSDEGWQLAIDAVREAVRALAQKEERDVDRT